MSDLFSPIDIGGLTLPNRIVVPPMCQYSAGTDGLPAPWHHMHIGTMAISGAGLVIVEGTAVEAPGRISPNDLGLYTDAQEAALRDLIARIRTFSATRIGIQIAHAGRKASNAPFDARQPVAVNEGGWVPIAPSPVPPNDLWPVPTEMTEADIARVVAAFVSAAGRADRAGFDLVEVHAAHGYLISSFLSPHANQRTDRYGGALANRMRFGIEVAQAVRQAWPRQKALGFRINGTDWTEAGIGVEEAIAFAAALKSAGADYVTVSAGGNSRDQKLPTMAPGYQTHLARAVRSGAGITTMTVGMILTAEQADEIVASGTADMVGVARATLDDPRWGLHAAQALGEEPAYPRPIWRAAAKYWAGYVIAHASGT
ncbi:NADH:flavin oxidoreductase/NADH oxidase [Bosea sp. (in: a-proteobacteria)]|uniref:NADH:flavin oxidoreductase/NADH oxidase n=1 Tax=Bosea sp. (in: a-proteobacteria) TaxID=1871050 RepID=UPI00260CD0B3|nr:NADH:flavin oxidoreductase/NADH oxidase [Bosea sp. (in: a-proteobacteria)]MCO5090737.1 NADH:flavin oxidoreductase/NADH oxidase [Bosea sp. (in: a-proteobacteria)]